MAIEYDQAQGYCHGYYW